MALAIGWTAGEVLERRRPRSSALRLAGIGLLAVVALASTVAQTVDATRVEPNDATSSRALRHLVPEVVDAIEQDDPARPEGRYLVNWTDPVGVIGELQG